MAELPEIMTISRQMNNELHSKEIEIIDIDQEKCLNMGEEEFIYKILGKEILNVHNRGKWIFIKLTEDYNLLLNLGMGADVLYYKGEDFEKEYQLRFHFTDNSGFTCKFWWFGRAELVSDNALGEHKPTKDIAISPLDNNFTKEYFRKVCKGRSQIKNIILNQKKIGGIGNVHVHDILFKAKIHPQCTVNTLKSDQIDNIYKIMIENLQKSLDKGGLAYEKNFYGENGAFSKNDFLVAYKEGYNCPDCGAIIEKIRSGNTSSYICPECQKL